MAGELILVVDDEANILDLARLYLEREGARAVGRRWGQGPGGGRGPRRHGGRRECGRGDGLCATDISTTNSVST